MPTSDRSSRCPSGTRQAKPVGVVDAALMPVAGGTFLVGNDDDHAIPGAGEGPVRAVTMSPFWIDAHAVSNARFSRFVEATGYRTVAERIGWSYVFAGLLPDHFPPTRGVAAAPWWRQVFGADWRRPEGPGSSVESRLDHPVVHIALADALAYSSWAGLRLATETEWEVAARGGLAQKRFPWGDELHQDGRHWCNVWQGQFPHLNTCEDGFEGTCPVDEFPANGLGLHNVSGNVWEWTASLFHPETPGGGVAIRGGSYLCHASYCERYRVSARTTMSPESSTGHLGFRCAWSETSPHAARPGHRPATAMTDRSAGCAPCGCAPDSQPR
jgi:sulfatase modifying factor 1